MFVGWLKRLYAALVKKQSSMQKSAVKDQLYGAIIEMMNSHDHFHKSSVGKDHEYSRWTDEGKEELFAFVLQHSKKMLLAEEDDLNNRARQLTFDSLKKPQ